MAPFRRVYATALLSIGACAPDLAAEDNSGKAAAGPPEVKIPVQRVAAPRPGKAAAEPPKISLEEAMYVPPKLRSRVKPVYPYALLREGVAGKAKVACMVDQNGVLVGARVMEATRPEFGEALIAALEAATFASATDKGEPIPTILGFEHAFSTKADHSAALREEVQLLERETKKPKTLGRPSELDGPLQPTARPAPVYPAAMASRGQSGEAVIEFLLDEYGIARLPRIRSASNPAFGYAAVQAVARWEFEPPTARGVPTVMRVVVPFRFETH